MPAVAITDPANANIPMAAPVIGSQSIFLLRLTSITIIEIIPSKPPTGASMYPRQAPKKKTINLVASTDSIWTLLPEGNAAAIIIITIPIIPKPENTIESTPNTLGPLGTLFTLFSTI